MNVPIDPIALASREPFFQARQIFAFFFVTLGPLKVLGPFAQATAGADGTLRRNIAFQAAAFAALGIVLAGYVGQKTMVSWGVSLPALDLAGAIILFLVAIRGVLDLYTTETPRVGEKATPSTALALSPLAFPAIVTPYGIAVVILFLSIERTQTLTIWLLLLAIVVLDLLAMLFARQLLRFLAVPLRLIASVLSVLQVALAVQMFIFGLNLSLHASFTR